MALTVSNQKAFQRYATLFATIIRIALYLLLIITTLAIMTGIVKSGINLYHALDESLESILQDVLLDAVFILALVEITSIIIGYLRDGSVHVRYIVDTVLIIMLNEIVTMWLKHPTLNSAISLSVIVGALTLVRIGVTRLSPNTIEGTIKQ